MANKRNDKQVYTMTVMNLSVDLTQMDVAPARQMSLKFSDLETAQLVARQMKGKGLSIALDVLETETLYLVAENAVTDIVEFFK